MAYIELNQTNFFHNLEILAQKAGGKEKLAIVLKDNAYGHGLIQIAELSKTFGVKHAIVRTLHEAATIRELFDTVLVLADTPAESAAPNIHITVNDLSLLSKLPARTKVELKIDSGMHRNGIDPSELEVAVSQIIEADLDLVGIFTHHRSADTLSSEFFWQKKNFDQTKGLLLALCEKHSLQTPRVHSLNSAGVFREEAISDDIVRVGIAAYGLLEMQRPLSQPPLKPVLSLWAQKIHEFPTTPSMRIGYSGKGSVSGHRRSATYDIGYGDGLLRLSDSQSYTSPEGIALVGRVSMDNIVMASTQESVLLIGNAIDYAKAADTISYEVTTRLHPHLKRNIVT